jgi:hypothetical protein
MRPWFARGWLCACPEIPGVRWRLGGTLVGAKRGGLPLRVKTIGILKLSSYFASKF